MTLLQKKQKIKKQLDKADNRLIDMIYAILEADNTTTIGYTIEGEKLTRGKLKKEVADAHLRIKKGQFVEHSKLVAQSKNW